MDSNKLVPHQYKSYKQMLTTCFNASLAAFYVGYSLVYAGFLTSEQFQIAILKDYGFNAWGWDSESSYNSLVQGSIPIGAIFGALLSSQVIRIFSRKNSFLFTNLISVIAILILVFVKNPFVFIIARVMQGICTGIYSAIVPLYINQLVTPDCSNLGSLNQILISFGQFFCCALSFVLKYAFSAVNDPYNSALIAWKVLVLFPLLTILIQTIIFVFIYSHQTPKYLFQIGSIQQGKKLIGRIYNQEYIQSAIDKFNHQTVISQDGSPTPQPKMSNSRVAIFFAIHIALLQQMSGVNAIAVYGKSTLEEALAGQQIIQMVATLGLYIVSVIAAIVSISLMNKKGRKFLIQLGTFVCMVCLGIVAISFFFKKALDFKDSVPQSIAIIIGMCVFMTFFGLTLGPIVWLYIPEIVEPNIIPYSTMTNLFGAAVCIIGFPLIAGQNASVKFVPFLFFFVWCLISFFINQKIMVETWNKPKDKVIEEYDSKKLC